MKKNKFVLPIILFLLIISLPLGIYGLLNNLNGNLENPNHEHYYNGTLYYYLDDGSYAGKYKCTTDNCEDVKPIIDIEEKLDFELGNVDKLSLINSKMALVQDGDSIKLYNVASESSIVSFGTVKNYNQTDENGYIAVKRFDSDKWGIFDTINTVMLIPMEYDYAGYIPNYLKDHFVVKKDNKYFIISKDNDLSTGFSESISYFTQEEVLLNNSNGSYTLAKYNGSILLNNIKKYQVKDDKIILLTNSNMVYIYDSMLRNQNIYNCLDFEIKDSDVILKLSDNTTKNISLEVGSENE